MDVSNGVMSTTPPPSCHVCEEQSDRLFVNYGALSCFSCRAFFRRVHQKGGRPEFICKQNQQCKINAKSRRKCQACRHRLCLESGMNPKMVLTEGEKKVRFKNFLLKKDLQHQQQQQLQKQQLKQQHELGQLLGDGGGSGAKKCPFTTGGFTTGGTANAMDVGAATSSYFSDVFGFLKDSKDPGIKSGGGDDPCGENWMAKATKTNSSSSDYQRQLLLSRDEVKPITDSDLEDMNISLGSAASPYDPEDPMWTAQWSILSPSATAAPAASEVVAKEEDGSSRVQKDRRAAEKQQPLKAEGDDDDIMVGCSAEALARRFQSAWRDTGLNHKLMSKFISFHRGIYNITMQDVNQYSDFLEKVVWQFAMDDPIFESLSQGDQELLLQENIIKFIYYVLGRYFVLSRGIDQLKWLFGANLPASLESSDLALFPKPYCLKDSCMYDTLLKDILKLSSSSGPIGNAELGVVASLVIFSPHKKTSDGTDMMLKLEDFKRVEVRFQEILNMTQKNFGIKEELMKTIVNMETLSMVHGSKYSSKEPEENSQSLPQGSVTGQNITDRTLTTTEQDKSNAEQLILFKNTAKEIPLGKDLMRGVVMNSYYQPLPRNYMAKFMDVIKRRLLQAFLKVYPEVAAGCTPSDFAELADKKMWDGVALCMANIEVSTSPPAQIIFQNLSSPADVDIWQSEFSGLVKAVDIRTIRIKNFEQYFSIFNGSESQGFNRLITNLTPVILEMDGDANNAFTHILLISLLAQENYHFSDAVRLTMMRRWNTQMNVLRRRWKNCCGQKEAIILNLENGEFVTLLLELGRLLKSRFEIGATTGQPVK